MALAVEKYEEKHNAVQPLNFQILGCKLKGKRWTGINDEKKRQERATGQRANVRVIENRSMK